MPWRIRSLGSHLEEAHPVLDRSLGSAHPPEDRPKDES